MPIHGVASFPIFHCPRLALLPLRSLLRKAAKPDASNMLMIQRADLSGSTRIEIPEVPVRAMKEAIINSLCHRDFYNPKTNEIAIYRDRIEIYNPGQFPFDHDPDEFIAGHGKSYPKRKGQVYFVDIWYSKQYGLNMEEKERFYFLTRSGSSYKLP